MGLLDNKEGTREEKLYVQRKKILDISQKLYQRMEAQHRAIFNMIWNDTDITAQEIFDEYGTDAYQLFVFSQNIQNMLSQANPVYSPLIPPYEYAINPDGTVTVYYPDPSIGDVS